MPQISYETSSQDLPECRVPILARLYEHNGDAGAKGSKIEKSAATRHTTENSQAWSPSGKQKRAVSDVATQAFLCVKPSDEHVHLLDLLDLVQLPSIPFTPTPPTPPI